MLIHSRIQPGQRLSIADQKTIKNETMLHRADYTFSRKHGGPLTHMFLDSICEFITGHNILIDSRVHFAPFNDVYFAIPGFHHDDVPRERSDGQPEYLNPSYTSKHAMCLFGNNAPTEFALGSARFDIPPVGEKIYKVWSPIVHKMLADGQLKSWSTPESQIVYFDWLSWHRATPATAKGFRFFIRATRNSDLPARNEIRMNANVYLPLLEEGW